MTDDIKLRLENAWIRGYRDAVTNAQNMAPGLQRSAYSLGYVQGEKHLKRAKELATKYAEKTIQV